MNPDHDPFVNAARRLLQDSEHALDAVTLARLSAARRRAVAEIAAPLRWWQRPVLRWPVLAAACAAALALVTLLPRGGPLPVDADALDYATAADAAVYEDLEFYQWLDQVDGAGSPRSPS
jgi:ferric-dicitrate binding protein FerR (iron transport regulator)